MYIFFESPPRIGPIIWHYSSKDIPDGYRLVKRRPSLLHLRNVLWFVLNLTTPKPFFEYNLLNQKGEIVSSAMVVGKIYKFLFMSRGGIHIGPCYTVAHERGRGFYPCILSRILRDFATSTAYMIVHKDNASSIRGVIKVGFKPFAVGHCTRIKRYVVDSKTQ